MFGEVDGSPLPEAGALLVGLCGWLSPEVKGYSQNLAHVLRVRWDAYVKASLEI